MAGALPPNVALLCAAFNQINATDEFHSVSELVIGKPYPLESAVRIDTKNGPKVKVRAVLDDGESWSVILPTRFSQLSDQELENVKTLSQAGYAPSLTFAGKKGKAYDCTLSPNAALTVQN